MSRRKKAKEVKPVTPETVIHSRLRRLADYEDIKAFFGKLVGMAGMLYIMFAFIFGLTPMKNNDMSPKISSGDVLFYYRLENKIRAQDVVVFQKDGKQYVGRVVASGGDTVEVTPESKLKVNGSTMVESDIFYPTPMYGDEVSYPLKLEENQFFILCDYRNGARDSRYFGAVDKSELKGKVLAIIRRSSL